MWLRLQLVMLGRLLLAGTSSSERADAFLRACRYHSLSETIISMQRIGTA